MYRVSKCLFYVKTPAFFDVPFLIPAPHKMEHLICVAYLATPKGRRIKCQVKSRWATYLAYMEISSLRSIQTSKLYLFVLLFLLSSILIPTKQLAATKKSRFPCIQVLCHKGPTGPFRIQKGDLQGTYAP